MEKRSNIAIIGGGVAGIVAAYLLDKSHHVTLIEANDYVGGHTNTITIPDGADAGLPVDTGFIVLNDRNYPNFQRFLGQLGVNIQPSTMSFSFYCRQQNLYYASEFPNGVFAQRRNLFRPSFLRMVRDIVAFNKKARQDLHMGRLKTHTLGDYLAEYNYSNEFLEHHLLPAASAIWSAPPAKIMAFPVESFLRFYENHGLLGLTGRPQWYTVVGGSHSYVHKFLAGFKGTVLKNSPVETVRRLPEGVELRLKNQTTMQFDKVVIATHADQALRMLADPSADEQRLLGAWHYYPNETILHTDASLMPPSQRAWSSWNYIRDTNINPTDPVSVTYYMNRLQRLKTERHYFVSLNETKPIAEQHIIQRLHYTHPSYTFESVATQPELHTLNGARHSYFCGSYFGYGFHEDAVRSAIAVGHAFGESL